MPPGETAPEEDGAHRRRPERRAQRTAPAWWGCLALLILPIAGCDSRVTCTTHLATADSAVGHATHADERVARKRSLEAACAYDCAITLTADDSACCARCAADVAAGSLRASTTCER